jgi:site-specific recombinase XerD
MRARHGFASFLGPDIEQFIAHKRSAGRRFEVEEKTLRLFDDFLLERHVCALDAVTPALIDEFLASRPRSRPRSYNHLRCTIGRLFAYLVGHGKVARNPLQSPPRRTRYQRSPFIFDQAAARRLLSTARALADRGGTLERGSSYYLIFAILYGLGLRVGEACRLCVKDVDLDRRVLVIRQTKFYKSRLVPFGPKLETLLRQQIARCRTGLYGSEDPETALFRLKGGRAVNPGTVSITFQQLVRKLHLRIPAGISPPRLHDLRHACAVGTLARWYRDGGDPQARLHILSTFLGHVDINSTAIYLTTTPELLDLANRRFEAFAATTLREGLA